MWDSEGFPISGNDNETKYLIFKRPAVFAAANTLKKCAGTEYGVLYIDDIEDNRGK